MTNIQEIYTQSEKNFLFFDSNEFQKLRKNIFEKFDLQSRNKKNNESLKHIDKNFLKFNYKFKNNSNQIIYSHNNNKKIQIRVLDGKILEIKSYDIKKSNIRINNIKNDNVSALKKIINYQKLFNKDYIFDLNALFLNSGYEIYIGKNQDVDIHIINEVSEKNLTIFQKNIITIEKNCKVKITDEHFYDKLSNNNLVNHINLEEGGTLDHLIFQKNKEKANLSQTSYANCKKDSKYRQLSLNISDGSVRNHHYANFLGENAEAHLDGIFFASSENIIDNKTLINHNLPNCISSQRYKGILTDKSKASYLSKTFVDRIAQKTEAYQLSKGILLADSCSFHSKPELRIFADDVKCSHGSTIGPIDQDLLFYLRSRGLNKKISLAFLIKSLFHDIVSDVKDKSFIEKFNYHSNNWLTQNNI